MNRRFLVALLLILGAGCCLAPSVRDALMSVKPSPDDRYRTQVAEAIADDPTGEGRVFLLGYFRASLDYVEAGSFEDRQTWHAYLTNSGTAWKYGAEYSLRPGVLFAEPFAWMEKAGPLTDDDRERLGEELAAVIASLEAAG